MSLTHFAAEPHNNMVALRGGGGGMRALERGKGRGGGRGMGEGNIVQFFFLNFARFRGREGRNCFGIFLQFSSEIPALCMLKKEFVSYDSK